MHQGAAAWVGADVMAAGCDEGSDTASMGGFGVRRHDAAVEWCRESTTVV